MKIKTQEQFWQKKRENSTLQPQVLTQVAEILSQVRKRGDEAIKEYTEKWDGLRLVEMEIPKTAWKKAWEELPSALQKALNRAKQQITTFQESQKPSNQMAPSSAGKILGAWYRPLNRVGLYVPGGKAAYPSTVLMTAIPAKVAGVEEIFITTPANKDGNVRSEVLAAAWLAGVDRVFTVGGAQAIAALAYGTESIPKVDKIVGPGNSYVAAAKKLVYGDVGIDSIAGPSELAIIADGQANPVWIAADLLAQAEHDEEAQTYLITTSRTLAEQVQKELVSQTEQLPRKEIIQQSLQNYHDTIWVSNLSEGIELASEIAPEHLSIQTLEPWAIAAQIRHAGAIFVGDMTPEAMGDYLAGPSHVLPTGGTARFSSGLSVSDFYTRTSILHYSKAELLAEASDVEELAIAEELTAHAASVRIRKEGSQ
ncbi:histidinol dehydrogenase [Risungbinella massiliensis]|uniref:histidinol dehydrogenase n=1 Tax=Risungbinella massiliensis TaxID=1329796 RepID=UPI0005CBB7B4|nr:histidinol dehydrogenase [Risungbinella massiliensis]